MAFLFSKGIFRKAMRVLKYTEETLETIARETNTDISDVRKVYQDSNRLGLVTYSVIDMIAWGTLRPLPKATYITSEVLEHYRFVDPDDTVGYREVEPLNKNPL